MQAVAAVAEEDTKGDGAEANPLGLAAVSTHCVTRPLRERFDLSREPRLQLGIALVCKLVERHGRRLHTSVGRAASWRRL